MKLAEALQERADLRKRIGSLNERLLNNACVQENEQPAEDPAELLEELEKCFSREQKLIAAVNLANSVTKCEGVTLTELLAKRDVLAEKENSYRRFLSAASSLAQRSRHTEIKIISSVNVRELQKKTDDISAELRKLNNIIQQANWTADIEID